MTFMLYPFENNKLYQIPRRAWQTPLARLVPVTLRRRTAGSEFDNAQRKMICWEAMRFIVNGELLI
jgi:hypothetical protein